MNNMQIAQDYLNTSGIIKKNTGRNQKWSIRRREMYVCNEGLGNCKLYLEEKYYIISFPDMKNLEKKDQSW